MNSLSVFLARYTCLIQQPELSRTVLLSPAWLNLPYQKGNKTILFICSWRWGVAHCSGHSGWVQKVLWLMATRTCAVSSPPFKNCFSFNCFYIWAINYKSQFSFSSSLGLVKCFTLPVLEPLTLPRMFWKWYRQNIPEHQITDPWEDSGDKGMCSLLEVISFFFLTFLYLPFPIAL